MLPIYLFFTPTDIFWTRFPSCRGATLIFSLGFARATVLDLPLWSSHSPSSRNRWKNRPEKTRLCGSIDFFDVNKMMLGQKLLLPKNPSSIEGLKSMDFFFLWILLSLEKKCQEVRWRLRKKNFVFYFCLLKTLRDGAVLRGFELSGFFFRTVFPRCSSPLFAFFPSVLVRRWSAFFPSVLVRRWSQPADVQLCLQKHPNNHIALGHPGISQ